MVVLISLVLIVVLDQLGVGGYRYGRAGLAVVLIVGLAALTFVAGPRSSRLVWTAVAAVIGAAATGVLVQRAPLSIGALDAKLDQLRIPFASQVGERTSGHSWCRPTCPVVVRSYRLPTTADGPAMISVGSALAREGLELRPDVVAELQRTRFVRLRTRDAVIEATLQARSDRSAPPVVEVQYAARR